MNNKFQYILSLFRQVYRIQDLPLDIAYSNHSSSKIQIYQGEIAPLLGKRSFFPDAEQVVWKTWAGKKIPFFFEKEDKELFTREGDRWIIHSDLVASAFYLLSGWNEYFATARDSYGRFPFQESVQYKLDFIDIPVVNYYFDILRTVIEEAYGIELKTVSPPQHDFTVCLSHDIDTCRSAWLQGGFHALKKGNIFIPVKLGFQSITGRDAWFNFDMILELEKRWEANSTFFFLPRSRKNLGIKNADYDIRDPVFLPVFESILNTGSEVGIHSSTGTHQDAMMLQHDMERMGTPVKGNRFHFLLYDPRITPKVISEVPLDYDTSLGFVEHYGFRSSFCHPYQPYDIAGDKPFGFYELPLTLMDGTLQKYLSIPREKCIDEVTALFGEVKKFGGTLSLLWHNTHFSEYKYTGWCAVYKQLLTFLTNENAWLTSCSNVLSYYSNKR